MSGGVAWKWHLGRCDDKKFTLVRGNLTKSKVGDYYVWKEESLDLTSPINASAGLCYWPAGTPVYRCEPSSDVSGSICWCEIGGLQESKASKVCKLFDGIEGRCIELQPMHVEAVRPAVAWLPNNTMVAIASFSDAANGGRTDIFSLNNVTSYWTATSYKLSPDKYKSDVSLVANDKYLYAVNGKVSKIELSALTSKTKKRGWRVVSAVPMARIWAGVILIDGRFLVVIGGVDRERVVRDDLVVFDTKSKKWGSPKVRMTHGRLNPSVVFCESSDCIVILGGYCEADGAAVPDTSVEVLRLADVFNPTGELNQTRLACVMPNNRPQPFKALQPIFGQSRILPSQADNTRSENAAPASPLADSDSEEDQRPPNTRKKTTPKGAWLQSILHRWSRPASSSTDSSRVTTASSSSSTDFFPTTEPMGALLLDTFGRPLSPLPEEDRQCSEDRKSAEANRQVDHCLISEPYGKAHSPIIYQISSPLPPADENEDATAHIANREDWKKPSQASHSEPFDINTYKWPTPSIDTCMSKDVIGFYTKSPRVDSF